MMSSLRQAESGYTVYIAIYLYTLNSYMVTDCHLLTVYTFNSYMVTGE